MTFKDAVEQTDQLKSGYRDGLQAVKNNERCKITCADAHQLEGSVDIDTCTKEAYPNAPRWDYAVGYAGKIYFIEVHGACTSNVKEVFAKLEWLRYWLSQEGSKLNSVSKGKPLFSWIASGKIGVARTSKEYRMAAQKNLLPVSKLLLS